MATSIRPAGRPPKYANRFLPLRRLVKEEPLYLAPWQDLRIAIVHEWISARAGSEQVFERLASIFPSADLYALSKSPGVHIETGERPIRTTFLDHRVLRDVRALSLPLMPIAWRSLGRGDYDLVITSHHAFANAHRLADSGVHLSYVHSPARYLWSPEIDARGAPGYLYPAQALLRKLDLEASRRVDSFAANSTTVAERLKASWGRSARVIHPPVQVEFFSQSLPERASREYVLGVGRWIPYKNLHLVVEAGDRAGLPVKIAGSGPDASRIMAAVKAASVPVEIIESPTNEELRSLYQNARCLVFPTVEDFGIVPVEAQAAGTPVVAPAAGGVLDTVVEGESGILVEALTPQALAEGVDAIAGLSSEACMLSAERFSSARFDEAILAWAEHALARKG